MADSADDLLARVRMGVASQPGEPVGDALEAFHELDELLSAGGPLPTAWVPAADRTVTGVPGPDIVADVREAQRRIEADEIADTWGA